MTRRRPPAVVSGLGTVGPAGAGPEALAELLAAGRPRLAPLAAAGALGTAAGLVPGDGVRHAGRVDPAALADWLPRAAARRMSPPSRYAVAAVRMALADAGLDAADEATAVVLATVFGPSSVTETILEQILLVGPQAASPAEFAESVANAPAAQAARLTAARGPNLTITQHTAGVLTAVARAAALVESGRAARALAGAVDETTPLLQALLERFGALARAAGSDEPPVARPFDRRRDGFVTGEGATVLVLEPAAAAAERGARVLARIAGGGGAFDPTATAGGWGTGAAPLAAALGRGLERAGWRPEDVDLVVAGASGSRGGDRVEALTLAGLWGERPLPPVFAPKGATGELGGGQLAAAVLALGGAEPGPSGAFSEVDPELGIEPHPGGPLPRPARRVLVTAFAAGGAASWLLLERP